MPKNIRIKPHHFVDIVTYYGADSLRLTPHPYGHDWHVVARRVVEEPEATLQLEFGMDDICAPCRHNLGTDCDDVIDISSRPTAPASKQAYNLLLDQRWCARLGLADGQRLPAAEMLARLAALEGSLDAIYAEMASGANDERLRNLKAGARKLLARAGYSARGPSG